MTGLINNAYLATSALAAFASLNDRRRNGANWWLALSIGLFVLGLLRIAEAGLWLDDLLQRRLHLMGWYGHRRPLQIAAVGAFALGLLIALKTFLVTFKRPSLTLAVGAFYLLAVLMAVLASSLHWTDALLQRRVGSLAASHAMQLLLLAVMSAAAIFEVGCSLLRKRGER